MSYHPRMETCDGETCTEEACHYHRLALTRADYVALWMRCGWVPFDGAAVIQSIRPKCIHLGEPVRNAEGHAIGAPCAPCVANGKAKPKLMTCTVHGSCTTVTSVDGIACCETCPDHARYAKIKTRNLLYHLAPFSGHGHPWRRSLNSLLKRWELFNGRRVVAIMTGAGLDPPAHARAAFGDRQDSIEFLEIPNVPGSDTAPGREVISFLPLFEHVENTLPTEATYWAHSKGATQTPERTSHLWCDVMHELALDYWPVVDRLLRQQAVAGSFRKRVMAWTSGYVSRSNWHYSGSFFWFRHDQLFGRANWREIDQFYSGMEPYPSLHFGVDDAACIFGDNTQVGMSLYTWDYWTNEVLPSLAEWRRRHAGDLTTW